MRVLVSILAACAMCATGVSSAEGLVGETLTFTRAYPTTSTPYWDPSSTTTTVIAGGGDVIHWKWLPGVSGSTDIDPEVSSIQWSGTYSEYIGSQSTFDGFVVSGFSQDIASVGVLSSGGFLIDIKRNLRSFEVNLNGQGSQFSLDVRLAPVPEPSSLFMVAAGVCVLALRRMHDRKR